MVGLLLLLSVIFCIPQPIAAKKINDTLSQEQIDFCCKIISENYLIPLEEVEFHSKTQDIQDLDKYAFLAYACKRDLEYVIDMKSTNTWARTEFMLGLTPNELKAAEYMSDANKLYVGLKMDYTLALSLLRQNFDIYETAMSILISEKSKKAPLEIAKTKTPKMTWSEVAKKNGVNEQEFAEMEAKINNCPNLNYLP
jgi:hypothetical protein